jgi:hypothetical protein
MIDHGQWAILKPFMRFQHDFLEEEWVGAMSYGFKMRSMSDTLGDNKMFVDCA